MAPLTPASRTQMIPAPDHCQRASTDVTQMKTIKGDLYKSDLIWHSLLKYVNIFLSIAQDSNNTFSSIPETLNSTVSMTISPADNIMASSSTTQAQAINQQQIDESPITSQLNKMLKKNKKDIEKKMLLDEDLFQ